MERFVIQPSDELPGYWVVTDTQNMVVCVFKEHAFNSDQRFTMLDTVPPEQAQDLAQWVNEMAQWLRDNHYQKLF